MNVIVIYHYPQECGSPYLTFLHQLTESGFDMTPWELPTRQKIPFKEFLTSICSHYKDYHLINLIEIY